MHEPSNATFPSSAASSSPMGMATFLVTPWMSLNCSRTKRTPDSLARLTSSRLLMVLFRRHLPDGERRPQRELAFRGSQIGLEDLRDLVEPVEDGMTVDAEALGCLFHVLADFEIQLQGGEQIGFVLAIVSDQRLELGARKGGEVVAICA